MTRGRTATPVTRELRSPPPEGDPLWSLGLAYLIHEYLTDEERCRRPREVVRSEVWG